MKTRLLMILGILLLVCGIVLHFHFSSHDAAYLETFSNSNDCKIILSDILNNLNKSIENNCPMQLHLLQSASVKLFFGLGIVLLIGELLMCLGTKENEN